MNTSKVYHRASLVALTFPLLLGGAVAGCTASSTQAPPADAVTEEPAPSKTESSTSDDLSSLDLVTATAEQLASRWDAAMAAEQQVELSIRVKIEGKSAMVVGSAQGARVLTGGDAVNTVADVTLEIARADAEALVAGHRQLKELKKQGKVQTDNEQGLDWFLQFDQGPRN